MDQAGHKGIDFRNTYKSMINLVRTWLRWMLKGLIGLIVVILLLHQFIPVQFEELMKLSPIPAEEFYLGCILVVVILVLERQFGLEENLERNFYHVAPSEEAAYRSLTKYIVSRKVQRVDLLQLSGMTALSFLKELNAHHPNVRVRILLLHHDIAEHFDTTNLTKGMSNATHINRINTASSEIAALPNAEHWEIRYYRSYPSLCSITVDNKIISAGWYRSYFDNINCLRVRSHDVPTIMTEGKEAKAMLAFASDHFNQLWSLAEENPNSHDKTTKLL